MKLSYDDYLKLDAYCQDLRLNGFVMPNSPDQAAVAARNAQSRQIKTLRDYNAALHKNRNSESECSDADNDQSAYVPAKIVQTLFLAEFPEFSTLTKYLQDPARCEKIRQRTPAPNRRIIHAADLLRVLFEEHELQQKARAELHGDKPDRRNK